ncbi:hypothetical protein LY13_003493 [Prauserella aidingensis]|uniref:hypothetical protein n=1 Tax=Prauserella aidingensis TaxID=387890 RepID=UPI0020A2C2F8|nr:hypothetical protein [Prauserella aidingensis]MCP2254723.1 hypothetical protein [Prauserella aidingensis]
MDDKTSAALSGVLGHEARAEAAQKAAKSMFTDAELKEMKTLLDDPNVSSEHRGQMLMALSNAGMVSHQEIDKYSNKYGYDAEDIKEGGEAPLENLVNAQRSLRRAQREAHQGKISDAKDSLQDLKSYRSSDQIIDKAKLIVKLFSEFYPKYTEVKSLGYNADSGDPGKREMPRAEINDPNSGQGKAGATAKYSADGHEPDDIRAGLDEFRGIEFHCFWQDSNAFSDTHEKVGEIKESLNEAWRDGTADWTGDAKGAADQRNSAIDKSASDLSEALNTSADSVMAGIDAVRECVAQYVEVVLEMYGDGRISSLVPSDIDTLIAVVQQFPSGISRLEEMKDTNVFQDIAGGFMELQSFGMHSGGVPRGKSSLFDFQDYKFAEIINSDNINQEIERGTQALQDAENQLKAFLGAYEQKAKQFHSLGQEYVGGIQTNYSEMINALNKNLGHVFGDQAGKGGDKPAVPAGQQTATQTANPVQGGGPPTGGGPQQPGGSPVGSPAVPPQASVDPAAAGEQAQGEAGQGGNGQPKPGDVGEGKNPVTGGKLETDPETGEPYPIDPETGEAVKDATERDTLTVEQGDKKLELAEPNADGEMAISVDDGNGQLKDYKLDFGNGEDASGGAQSGGPTEGGPAQAAGQNQGPGGEGQGPGAGQEQNPGEQDRQDFGPQGSGDGADGGQGAGQGEKVYTPDEDGKIRIQDGDTEIVAEQPDGPDGPTTVTVDDGKGEPTTYTLGEEQSEPSAAGGGGMRPGGGGAEFAGRGMTAEPADVAGRADAADGGVAQAAQDGGPQAASDVDAADAGSVTGDLGAAGGGTPAEPSGDAMQAAASASAAGGAPSMPDDMGSSGGGAPESGGGTPAAEPSPAGRPGGDQAPAADTGNSGGADDSTSPASSLGSSLGDDALGGGSGEAGGGSLGDAGMGDSADGGAAADSGDGDNGGPGGSGDRGGGSGAAGSGMMGGGMGGAGGGGGGGDEERQSQFVLNAVSDLFGEAVAGNHITGTIGEGVEPAVSFSR